jgi:isoleucyl-tRNA synthetase
VPITIFRCLSCGEYHLDQAAVDSVFEAFKAEGADAWFARPAEELLPPETTCPACSAKEWTKETDILDVWFDSGTSWAAVLKLRDELTYPSDMYLEGSDQHRGWFHSSLLCSVATEGIAPYKGVLTHGYVVDQNGRKMAKSLGNIISPQEMIKKYGAEILRLWVASEDYTGDVKISQETLKRMSEAYRRIRNTCRFLLGNLADFDPAKDSLSPEEMFELDRWALHVLAQRAERIIKAYDTYEYHTVFHTLNQYCTVDLSNLYLDVLKDRLYTYPARSQGRRSAQCACFVILTSLVKLMAPVLSFLAEEIWDHLPQPKLPSVHMEVFPRGLEEHLAPDLAERYEKLLAVRAETTLALEGAREKKLIGNALDAFVVWQPPEAERPFYEDNLAGLIDLCLVSGGALTPLEGLETAASFKSEKVPGLTIAIQVHPGQKCPRCWMRVDDLGRDPDHPEVCGRCAGHLREAGE